MYTLTERRFKKAETILEKYREQMLEYGKIQTMALERDLRVCWNTGYREIKYIMIQLLKDERYVYLAAYFMEHSNSSVGVVMEFQDPLVTLYGAKSFYHDKSYKEKREDFWNAFEEKR